MNSLARFEEDIFDGVSMTCRQAYPDGLMRMRSTVQEAVRVQLSGTLLGRIAEIFRPRTKMGICHMLVNEKRMRWVRADG